MEKLSRTGVISLSSLSKKGKGKKSGRKRPRVEDLDVLPAPDSHAANIPDTQPDPRPDPLPVPRPDPVPDPLPNPQPDIMPDVNINTTVRWLDSNEVMKAALTEEDKRDISNGHWLNDRVIDASCQIIKHQYKGDGLQSCLFTENPQHFQKIETEWIQIVNTTPKGGSHWVVLSTYGIEVDNSQETVPAINIYDSLWTGNTSKSMIESIDAIMYAPLSDGKCDVRHMKCDRQPNMSDCGIHAIANVVAILEGTDPAEIRYLDSDSMRSHLIYCLENQSFSMFPHVDFEEEEQPIHTQSIVNTPKRPTKKSNKLSHYLPKLPSPALVSQRGRKIKKNKRQSFVYH